MLVIYCMHCTDCTYLWLQILLKRRHLLWGQVPAGCAALAGQVSQQHRHLHPDAELCRHCALPAVRHSSRGRVARAAEHTCSSFNAAL
jgi:hypothetical protein